MRRCRFVRRGRPGGGAVKGDVVVVVVPPEDDDGEINVVNDATGGGNIVT